MEYRISSTKMQDIVQRFTMGGRYWTAFDASRIESMAIWAQEIPQNAHYRLFDPDKEELVFGTQPTTDEIMRMTPGMPEGAVPFSVEITRPVTPFGTGLIGPTPSEQKRLPPK